MKMSEKWKNRIRETLGKRFIGTPVYVDDVEVGVVVSVKYEPDKDGIDYKYYTSFTTKKEVKK